MLEGCLEVRWLRGCKRPVDQLDLPSDEQVVCRNIPQPRAEVALEIDLCGSASKREDLSTLFRLPDHLLQHVLGRIGKTATVAFLELGHRNFGFPAQPIKYPVAVVGPRIQGPRQSRSHLEKAVPIGEARQVVVRTSVGFRGNEARVSLDGIRSHAKCDFRQGIHQRDGIGGEPRDHRNRHLERPGLQADPTIEV